jgi:hypothetical protein
MEPKACVLVTDGQERSALAVTRDLGNAGIPVVVGAGTHRSLVGRCLPILQKKLALPATTTSHLGELAHECR